MKNFKILLSIGVVVLLLGILLGCEERVVNKKEPISPTGALVGHTGCKIHKENPTDSVPSNQSCVEYSYDGQGILLLKHINAGFNCGVSEDPDGIIADITVENHTITIAEKESLVIGANCVCLFDLDLEITNLSTGEYTIKVIEPYLCPGDQVLEFIINLSLPSSGRFCVERTCYPWGDY
jgi:hypothetical protein